MGTYTKGDDHYSDRFGNAVALGTGNALQQIVELLEDGEVGVLHGR